MDKLLQCLDLLGMPGAYRADKARLSPTLLQDGQDFRRARKPPQKRDSDSFKFSEDSIDGARNVPRPSYLEAGLAHPCDIAQLSPDNAYAFSGPSEFDCDIYNNVEVVFMINQTQVHKPQRAIDLSPEVTMTGDEFPSAHSWNEGINQQRMQMRDRHAA
jgi:hypothetical protein